MLCYTHVIKKWHKIKIFYSSVQFQLAMIIIKSTYCFESRNFYLQTGFAFKITDCGPFIRMKFKDKFTEVLMKLLFELNIL